LGVVFVHGVRSSAKTWDAFASLIADDEQLRQVVVEPVPRFEYASGIMRSSWKPLTVIPSISTAADKLKAYLETQAEGLNRLVLVGHSQGGLVIQRFLARMLSEGRGLELARIRRVILLATPNTGSELWLSARRALVWGNPQEAELRPYNEMVADTARIVQRDIVHASAVPTARSCRIPFSVYAGEQDKVVTRAAAQGTFPDAAVLPGDHFTIVKPDSPRHYTYATVRRLLLADAADGPDPPVDADTVTTLGPTALEVHNAADADGSEPGQIPELTTYLSRTHDRQLRGVLAKVLGGGPSRLVMLTGESSTGKTRALYEALVELAPHAPLLHPTDGRDLLAMLDAGRVRPGRVLWLNETQRFLYGAQGEESARRLRSTLSATTGITALGTLWNTPYWNEVTGPNNPGNVHEQAKALLIHPAVTVRLNVPAHLNAEDLGAWNKLARVSGDRRLQQAHSAGASDGKVVQHLSAGPELLAAYRADDQGGRLFTAAEHALITAALDARRLGHRGPLPAALLAAAADGDLPARHRSPDPDWAKQSLCALADGRRKDGTRTDIRATLTALTAVYTRSGTEADYEPADYLDQQCRHLRVDRYGTSALWAALIEHTTDPDDHARLGWTAWNRGLRLTAVRLWLKAGAAGDAAYGLAQLGRVLDPGQIAAVYTAKCVDLANPGRAGSLLRTLRETRADQATATLLSRYPATHADLADPDAVGILLEELREAGAEQAATVLAERIAAHADPTDPRRMVWLLNVLGRIGAEYAVAALLGRDPADHADLADAGGVGWLLRTLREVRADHAVAALLARDPATHANAARASALFLLKVLQEAEAEQAVTVLAERIAADRDISNLFGVATVLESLQEAGAEQAVTVLAVRAAAFSDLTDPLAVSALLRGLRRAGAVHAVAVLLARDPAAHTDPTSPAPAAALLTALREAGAGPAVTVLAERAAAFSDLTNPVAVSALLNALREAGAEQAGLAFEKRAQEAHFPPDQFAPYGREPDGKPSPPWTTQSLASLWAC
jgi:hypothetical protein